jgi:DNA-binding Lrp family transcriptional regulator
MELSAEERKMLEVLRNPGNWAPRITRIANALGIPTSTAQSRLKRLERGGVFSGFGAASSDYGFACFAVGRARDPTEAAPKLLSVEGVEEVHAIAGESNVLVRFRAQDREGYLATLQQISGVFHVRFASLSAKSWR